MITLIAVLCGEIGLTAWRQSDKNISDIRMLFNHIRCIGYSGSKDEQKKEEKKGEIIAAHEEFICSARKYPEKTKLTMEMIRDSHGFGQDRMAEIVKYVNHAGRQIDQMVGRVIRGVKIPQSGKVTSVFEEHTGWMNKGKAGVPQELGIRVCISEDRYRFIPHHHVMKNEADSKVAILMTSEAKRKFPDLASRSSDKGFHSKINKEELEKISEVAILPKKGKLSVKEKETENSEESVRLRHEHSAVESAMNALENHGSDRCPDHGIEGFRRYVAAIPDECQNALIL